MKVHSRRRAAAMLVSLLALAAALGIATTLLSTASLTIQLTRATNASVIAERIALDLEPLVITWSSENASTHDGEDAMPAGWFDIHEFENDDTYPRVRIRAIDLTGCVSLHPEASGRIDALPDPIQRALVTAQVSTDATLESLVDTTLLPEDARFYPPVHNSAHGFVLSEWITHIDTGGWNARTVRDQLRIRSGIETPVGTPGPRNTQSGTTRLIAESNAFAFLIDIEQPALLVRTWLIVARPRESRNQRAPWHVVERRRLP